MSIKINEQHDTWDIIGREIQGKHPKDLFGYQVSLSEGGKRLGIGAPQDPEMGENSGAVSITSFKVAHTTHNLENHYMGMAKCVYLEVLCQYRRMGSMLRLGVTWVSYIVTIMENRLNIR